MLCTLSKIFNFQIFRVLIKGLPVVYLKIKKKNFKPIINKFTLKVVFLIKFIY